MRRTVEQRILECAADPHPGRDKLESLGGLMARGPDPDRLLGSAVKEGLAGLLYRNLKRAGCLDRLGPGHQGYLRGLYDRTVLFNLKLTHGLEGLLAASRGEGRRIVLLQGMSLLYEVYGEVGLRPMTDIDLWVQQGDYAALTAVLADLGYRPDPVYPRTYRRGPVVFDLHTCIMGGDRIRSRRWLMTKDQEELYRGTRPITIGGQEARCLGPCDQVLYLGLHGLKHRMGRLIWLADIMGVLAGWSAPQWRALGWRAAELGQEKTLRSVLYLLDPLFGLRPPPAVRGTPPLGKARFLERRILRQRLVRGAIPYPVSFLLFSPEGALRCLGFLLETLFPRPEVLRQVFAGSPKLKLWQLYPMRVLQLMGRIRLSLGGRS